MYLHLTFQENQQSVEDDSGKFIFGIAVDIGIILTREKRSIDVYQTSGIVYDTYAPCGMAIWYQDDCTTNISDLAGPIINYKDRKAL